VAYKKRSPEDSHQNRFIKDSIKGANFGKNDYQKALNLTPKQVKSACNWQEAKYSEEFQVKLKQEPNQEIDCSHWNKFLGIK